MVAQRLHTLAVQQLVQQHKHKRWSSKLREERLEFWAYVLPALPYNLHCEVLFDRYPTTQKRSKQGLLLLLRVDACSRLLNFWPNFPMLCCMLTPASSQVRMQG
jgi:hypothetical protein